MLPAPPYPVVMTANGQSRLQGLAGRWKCVSGHCRTSCYFLSGLSFSYFNTTALFSQSFSCLQALLSRKQGQSTTCTCKERNTLLPRRGALVSEPWEMVMLPHSQAEFPMATDSRRAGNQLNSWHQNAFSICKAVLNPQETLRINFGLSFLFAQYQTGQGELLDAFKNALIILNPSCASAHWRQLFSHGLLWINNPGSVWYYCWTRF